jgi:hypothetical protein
VVITPFAAAGQGLKRAYLEIVSPKGVKDPVITLCFNPTEYQLQKSNSFADIAIPGLESPPIQFVRGDARKLTTELLADTSDTLEDVREKHVAKLEGLMKINGELHAPPIVRLTWGTEAFTGVLESLGITYVLFTPEGMPLRAKLAISLKEYRPAAAQLLESKTNSPDVEKTWVVRRGDTLASIAMAVFNDPNLWREIARANDIQDPRRLRAGGVLTVPRLR